MEGEMFEELLEGVRQGGQYLRGKRAASRVFEIKSPTGDTIKIDYEHERVVDGTVADVSFNGQEVSTMVYCEDLDQWNDCLNPGEIEGPTDIQCALRMVQYYRK